MHAIGSVGSVLAPYDTDQMYPCFGFGAKVPPHYQVSHCFALNGNEQSPEVVGVDVGNVCPLCIWNRYQFTFVCCNQGILGAYQYTLSQVHLHGPTNFSSFLDRVIQMASAPMTEQNQFYYILLIITVSISSICTYVFV